MKTNLRILGCAVLLGLLPLLARAAAGDMVSTADAGAGAGIPVPAPTGAEALLDKVLPEMPKTDKIQVSGIFYVTAVSGTAECRAYKIANLRKGDVIDARGTSVRTRDNSTATIVFSNQVSLYIQPNTEFRIEKFDQEPFEPNNNLLIEPSNSQLIVFVRFGQVVISTPQLLSGTRIVFETPHAACYIVNDESGGEQAFLEVSTNQTHFATIKGMGNVKVRQKDGTLASLGKQVPKGQQAFVRYAWNGNGDDTDKSHPPSVDVSAGAGGDVPATAGSSGDTAASVARTPWGRAVPQDQFLVTTLSGTVHLQTKDGIRDLKQDELLTARGSIIRTDASSAVSLVLGNETRLTLAEKSEMKVDKFDQEPFAPNNNLDVEPSNSQTVVLLRTGHVDVDTPQLLSGTTLAFETPHGAIGFQNNQSGGQQGTIDVNDKQTHVQMITGLASVREKAPDGAFVNLGYNLKTGEQASVKPTLGSDPKMAAETFEEIKAAESVPLPEAGNLALAKATGLVELTANGKTVVLRRGDAVPAAGATIKTAVGVKATVLFSNQATLTLGPSTDLAVETFTQQLSSDAATPGAETAPSQSHFYINAGQVDLSAPQLAAASNLTIETVYSSIAIPVAQTTGTKASILLTPESTQIHMQTGQAEIKQRGLDGTFVASGVIAKPGDLAIVKPVQGSDAGASESSITAIDLDAVPVAPPGAVATTVNGEATVLRVLGSAQYRLAGQPDGGDLTLDTKLPVGASVETAVGSEVYLQPYPGAIAVLKPSSKVAIEKLAITTAGDVLMKREVIFNLKAGNMISTIDPAKHNINRYAVRTPKGLAQAQGTSFTTSVSADGMEVATTADSVTFTTPAGVTYTIAAGNVTESTAGGGAQAPIALSQAVTADPAFAAVVQAAMNAVTNIVQNNIGNLPTNSAANLLSQVSAVAAAAEPANAAAYATQAVTAVTAPGSATGGRPDAAAAAVIAAISAAAPAQVGAITNAGVQAAPAEMVSVAGAAAAAVPAQSGAITTAALSAYTSNNPQGTTQAFNQAANSVAAAVVNASPTSAPAVATAAMTAISQNNPSASAATLTQNATNLAATITAQATTEGSGVSSALVSVVTTAIPTADVGQVTASINAGVAAGQQVAATTPSSRGTSGTNGGNRRGSGTRAGGGAGAPPTSVSITQTGGTSSSGGSNGGTGGTNGGSTAGGNGSTAGGSSGGGNPGGTNGGGTGSTAGNNSGGAGGNGGTAGGGGASDGSTAGGGGGNSGGNNSGGGNSGGGNGSGTQQSTSVVITALTGGDTTTGGSSSATSILVTQLNGGQQVSVNAAVSAAANAASTVSFSTSSTSSGSNTPSTPQVVANPTTPTTPPTNYTVSSSDLSQ